MRARWIIALGLLLLGVGQPRARGDGRARPAPTAAHAQSEESKPADLVLVGTVTRMYPSAAPRSRRRWAVEVRVERVESGEFSGPTFAFSVHSPSRAGLRVKRTYVVRARRVGEVYVVDESALEEVRARKKPAGER